MRQPENLIEINYAANQSSVDVDELGMRDMQRRVFAEKDAQYLLVKAPPASGKSRALMFVALDKLFHQGINKVIIAVPERSIGGSFADEPLSQHLRADQDRNDGHERLPHLFKQKADFTRRIFYVP